MTRRAIHPYRQGQMDHLCGLYAITNALRWALKDTAALSKSRSKDLLSYLISDLQKRRILEEVFSCGMTIPDLGRSLKAASHWLHDETGYSLTARKPLHGSGTSDLKRLAATTGRHLSNPDSAVIIGTAGRLDHWTVVTDVSADRFSLFDSEGQKWFRRKTCVCGPLSAVNTAHLYLIPNSLFALTIQSPAYTSHKC